MSINDIDELNEDLVTKLTKFWEDPKLKKSWPNISPNLLFEGSLLEYHMNNLTRYQSENYLPTFDEILKARQRTTGYEKTDVMVLLLIPHFNLY